MAETGERFDPYGVLQALDRQRVKYVVIGGFARVLQGTEEITRGIDIVPSVRGDNLNRLDRALREIHAMPAGGTELEPLESSTLERPVLELTSDYGDLKVIPTPIGTQGYDDLRLMLVSRFAQQTRLVAAEGSRDALVAKFLEAAAIQRDNPDCELMLVSESPVEHAVVYLTEVWTSEEAWATATRGPEISAWAKGMSTLVAEEPESIRLAPIGGKGLPEPRS